MKRPRLLVLGASNAQLPIIIKAQELGCHVITVDNVPANIGHQFSHQSINCSTVDHEAVLRIAKKLDIEGIVTFASDIATTTVAFVATHLDLPGCQPELARTTSNKANFRIFQHQHKLDSPWFFITQQREEVDKHYPQLSAPLIFKPVDTSGSRGIIKLNTLNLKNCREAFTHAQSYARSDTVSIEEFIEGTDISGDGFLIDGQLHAVISKKYQHGFTPSGHYFPTNQSLIDQQRIFSAVEKTCHALAYRNGPIDFDIKISSERVVIIEMAPRLGGNGIPELIHYSTGIDLVAMTVNYALGNTCPTPAMPDSSRHCASWIFGSETMGTLESITPAEELKSLFPELLECRYNYQVGDQVPAFEHSGNSLGFMLFSCPPDSNYQSIIKKLHTALQLRIAANKPTH